MLDSQETPRGLLRDLAPVFAIMILIPLAPLLTVLPSALGRSTTEPYVAPTIANGAKGPSSDCADRNYVQDCRPIAFEWRSGWRDWEARWDLPDAWVYDAIRQTNDLAGSAARSPERADDLLYWSRIYREAARLNRDRVEIFARGFQFLARRHGLSRRATLELVTAFVQNLEYAVPDNYLQLYLPARLLQLGRGDCDSRALFLVLVLDRMGYDAVLLLSPRYRHAMAGVVCESCQGAVYRGGAGGPYRFIETTARTPPGFLHPAVSNHAHWHVLSLD
ncbi:MAG: hypothetical protein RIF32_22375 [Leptospirales bacterium]|jgi:hypothetical protein